MSILHPQETGLVQGGDVVHKAHPAAGVIAIVHFLFLPGENFIL